MVRVLCALVLAMALLGFSPGGGAPAAVAATDVDLVASDVETDPVPEAGDAADDPAIWRHPTDPGRSMVIVNDKLGGLESYDMEGHRIQRISDDRPFWGNVDVRQDVTVAGRTRDVVAVNHKAVQLFAVDPATRLMTSITDGESVGQLGEGLCLYESAISDKLYVINITLPGRLRQFEIGDADDDGLLEATLVRDFPVGSESEGCVADDETGALYVAEEDVALWRYEAEPSGGTARAVVDQLEADGGHLVSDIEGLAIADAGPAGKFLMASAQNVADPGNSYFALYRADGFPTFVRNFRITDGSASDDCDRTDGIDVAVGDFGPQFPQGIFVCQDDANQAPGVGNQDVKYVGLQKVLDLDGGGNMAPVARFTDSCEDLRCDLDASASSDKDGTVTDFEWNFGDGSPVASGTTTQHRYSVPGSYVVTLTVSDDGGAAGSSTRVIDVGAPAQPIAAVGQATSPIENARGFSLRLPSSTQAGDGVLLLFSATDTPTLTGPGAGWELVRKQNDGELVTTLWQRVATAADAGTSVGVSTGSSYTRGQLTAAVYRGTSDQGPVGSVATGIQPGTSTTHQTPTLPSAPVGTWRASFWAVKSGNVSRIEVPAAETVRMRADSTGGGHLNLLLSDSDGPVPNGTQGARIGTTDVAAAKVTLWTVLLAPGGTAEPPTNTPPVAEFTQTCTALHCDVDASASKDPDGSISSYEWDFGDDTGSVTGRTTQHDYPATGSYVLTLTVTDNQQATTSTTEVVTVSQPTQGAIRWVEGETSLPVNARSFSVTMPAGTRAGDQALLFFSASQTSSFTGPGAGWSQVESTLDGDHVTTLWRRTTMTGDAGAVVGVSTGGSYTRGVLSLSVYRGVDPVAPLAQVATAVQPGTSAEQTTPVVINTIAGAWRASFWSTKSSTVETISIPDAETVRLASDGTAAGRTNLRMSDAGGPVGTGPQGGITATASAAVSKATMWTILLRPA